MRRPVQGIVVALLLVAPSETAAEWQFKPFVGFSFGPSTTYVDIEHAAGAVIDEDSGLESGSSHMTFGLGILLIGEVLGLEADFGRVGGFFEAGDQTLIQRSSVQTLTGNVVIAVPRRLSQYSLRPYFVAGMGLMTVRIDDNPLLNQIDVSDRISAVDFGGGVTGFFTDRIGVSWDLRHFRSLGAEEGDILFENGKISFWRANMSVVLRY
jgi:hypothetical protein